MPSTTREEIGREFDQPVLAYLLIDDTPHVLVPWGHTLVRENLELKRWRTGFEWNWDGDWTALVPTTEAGSALPVNAMGGPALVGEINDPTITTLRISALALMETRSSMRYPGLGTPC